MYGNYIGDDIDYAQNMLNQVINFNDNTASSYVESVSKIVTNQTYIEFVDEFGSAQDRIAAYSDNRLIFKETDLDSFYWSAVTWHYNTVINNTLDPICGPNTFLNCGFGSILLLDLWNDVLINDDPKGKLTASPNRDSVGMMTVNTGVVSVSLWNTDIAFLSKQTLENAFDTVFNVLGTQTYVGYRNDAQSDVLNYFDADYGVNNKKIFQSLQKIKKQYDEDDFFHIDNVSIPSSKDRTSYNAEKAYSLINNDKEELNLQENQNGNIFNFLLSSTSSLLNGFVLVLCFLVIGCICLFIGFFMGKKVQKTQR